MEVILTVVAVVALTAGAVVALTVGAIVIMAGAATCYNRLVARL